MKNIIVRGRMKKYIIILLILMACSPDNTVSITEETPKEENIEESCYQKPGAYDYLIDMQIGKSK